MVGGANGGRRDTHERGLVILKIFKPLVNSFGCEGEKCKLRMTELREGHCVHSGVWKEVLFPRSSLVGLTVDPWGLGESGASPAGGLTEGPKLCLAFLPAGDGLFPLGPP